MPEPLHSGPGIVLTHGAGADCDSRLLVAVDKALTEAGFLVQRYNMPYRQQRPHGPPIPAQAAADRAGLKAAAGAMRDRVTGKVALGGHSYGGRQSSMLLAEDPAAADLLLALSYPLHPPRKPDQLRTAHLPNLRTPAVFIHGTRDPFGSIDELSEALKVIPANVTLNPIDGAGHDLSHGRFDIDSLIVRPLLRLL